MAEVASQIIISGGTWTSDLAFGDGLSTEITGNTVQVGFNVDYLTQKVLGSAVYSINGVYGSDDGSFFIHGSNCDSWGYVSGSTAYPMEEAVPIYKYREDGSVTDIPDTDASGIWITDLCPACQTCDEVYKIKQEIEQMEILVNMIKDVELNDTVSLEKNKAALEALCIDGSSVGCDPVRDPMPSHDGRQLLQQYITVAHMWNYAVVQNNASFKLDIAPEDTAGFTVQTKRSLPNCDNTWYIRCTVKVSYVGTLGDDDTSYPKQPLSVYVPEPKLIFKPFSVAEDIEVGGTTTTLTAEDAALNDAAVHVQAAADCTTKTIFTDTIQGRVGGTYELIVKILPFINFVMYDKNNNVISVRGGTINVSGTTSGDYVLYDFAPDHCGGSPIQNPDKQAYLNAKTAPTASVPFNNLWQVEILWEVGKQNSVEGAELVVTPLNTATTSVAGNTTASVDIDSVSANEYRPDTHFEYKETRLYTCTGVRQPNAQAMVTGTTVPVDLPVTPPEE